MRLCTLPNGLTVGCPGIEDEMRHVYQENMVEQQYLQHGITLSPGDTVIDVGANAGIFAVCAAQAAGPTGRVLALEPSPAASECARFNVKAHAEWLARQPGAPRAAPVEVLQVACGDGGAESLTLLEYDNVSVLNSVVPNYQQAHTMVRSVITTQLEAGKSEGMGGSPIERALLRVGRWAVSKPLVRPIVKPVCGLWAHLLLMQRRSVEVEMVTISGLMQDKRISTVDLLKVDVERAELAVIKGVRPADWPRIKQAAVEVHKEMLKEIQDILATIGGFSNIVVTEADQVIGPDMLMIHATRTFAAAPEE